MIYLILGVIVCLTGLGLMSSGNGSLELMGVIVLIIGAFIISKGRKRLSKSTNI